MKSINHLGGKLLTVGELHRVELKTGLSLPTALAEKLTSLPLVGLTFVLDVDKDESGLGVEMLWMTADQMLDEAMSAYPGIAAARKGLLPVGICLEGTGDPYFLRLEDGAIVRVPHNALSSGELDVSRVERIAASIEDLINEADVAHG